VEGIGQGKGRWARRSLDNVNAVGGPSPGRSSQRGGFAEVVRGEQFLMLSVRSGKGRDLLLRSGSLTIPSLLQLGEGLKGGNDIYGGA